jgi:hypothetical protein
MNIENFDRTYDGINLIETCSMCPEQYDAFDAEKKQVGYIRLRHGHFTVECPDVFGEVVYENDTIGDGSFIDENERKFELQMAVNAIKKWIKENKLM